MNPIRSFRNTVRNAPWIVMAVAVHVIGLIVIGLVYVQQSKKHKEERPYILSVRPPKSLEVIEIPEPEQIRDPMRIPPEMPHDLTTFDTEIPPDPNYVPTVDEPLGNPDSLANMPIGDPGGTSIGVGEGGHHGVGPGKPGVKPGFPPRGKVGGIVGKKIDEAVLYGMGWLLRHQNADGSWSATALKQRCSTGPGCSEPGADYHALYDEGVTALALLAFLGAGESHESKASIVDPVTKQRRSVGDAVKRGLLWLAQRQSPDGHVTRDKAYMYNEALATMALAEAYGLTSNRTWREPAQKGLDFLQRAQRPNPSGRGLWGWRYESRMEVEDFRRTGTDEAASKQVFDADTSVTTWCVMALKSGRLAGLDVRDESLAGAQAFVQWVSADNGQAGYVDPKGAGATVTGKNDHFQYHPAVMSALSMCTRIFTAHDPSDPFLEPAARQLVQDLPSISKDKLSVDYYYWYYGSLALNQFDGEDRPARSGKYWGPWRKAMEASLLALQNRDERSCQHGGWVTPDRWAYTGGPVYATALNVLTLEVYYRYENAFRGLERARRAAQPDSATAPLEPK